MAPKIHSGKQKTPTSTVAVLDFFKKIIKKSSMSTLVWAFLFSSLIHL